VFDGGDYDDLTPLLNEEELPDRFEDGRLAFNPMEDSGIPQGESIEMDDLTDKFR